MTDRERYRTALDEVIASGIKKTEASTIMENAKSKRTSKRFGGLLIAAVLLIIGVAGAYAADVGGMRSTLRLWIRGAQVDTTVTVSEGSYRIEDADGNVLQSGGGIAISPGGQERPLTEEEILEDLQLPTVEVENVDGRMLLYYIDQTIDLTDRFENGICRIELPAESGTLYVSVRSDGSYSVSCNGFDDP